MEKDQQAVLTKQPKKTNWKWILLLQLAILLFACCTLLMKFAAQYEMLSWPWILLYGTGVAILGSYAIIWQQFLKRMPLVTVYANRASAMFWSMIFGYFLFHESIRWNMIAGVAVIFVGIYLVVTSDVE
jgi:drug/metabolite transporter (DMT)-like permease